MNAKLVELTAKRDMMKEIVITKKKETLDLLVDTINHAFASMWCGTVVRRDVRKGLWDELEICFEVGFKNGEDKIDFGSSVDFEYTTRTKKLAINYGTCGYFCSNDIHQFQRLKMLGYVAENIKSIEEQIEAFIAEISEYLKLVDEYDEARYELDKLEVEDRKAQAVEIANSIAVNKTILEYDESVEFSSRVLPDKRWMDGFAWGVTKITPKFVTLINLSCNAECKVRKDALVNEIVRNRITIK